MQPSRFKKLGGKQCLLKNDGCSAVNVSVLLIAKPLYVEQHIVVAWYGPVRTISDSLRVVDYLA